MKRLRTYLSVIGRIFAQDVRRIVRNPIAVIVLAGVCLLPSLYAWYIVAANWDPYQNTENLKVAVVNNDEGADSSYTGHVDVGEEVVAALRENHQMGWEFVSQDEATQRVQSGEYYAAIVLPKDFSARFLSAFDGHFERPQIDYYINEKLSGSGAKIVDAGAETVQKTIDEQFVKMVSDQALAISQRVGGQVVDDEHQAEENLAISLAQADADIGQTRSRIDQLRTTVSSIKQSDASELGALRDSVAAYVATAKSQIATAADASDALLGTTQENLADMLASLQALQSSTSYTELRTFLGLDDDQVASFMSQPVQLHTEKVYPVANYGSGVAPFFTNLALWVSSLLVLALMRVRVDPQGLPPFTATQAYFGRWLLLMVISVIQSTIVCAGDVLMGIQCESPAAFIGAGVLAGAVYANLMFALVYSMRHVGKALAIVLLIIQIPGSSGMFPIQMMPTFFQVLNPLLPFTYSIDAMREAIGGFYGLHYLQDMLVLALVFGPVGFAVGLGFGRCSYNLNVMFDKKLAEGGLFTTEAVLGGAQQMRFRAMVRALMKTPEYRLKIQKRAKRFDARYDRLVRAGWVALFALPAVMICLLIVLRGGVDRTLMLLALFVVGTLVVVGYLVTITYVDMNIASCLKLAGKAGKAGEVPRKTSRKGPQVRKPAQARKALEPRKPAQAQKTLKLRKSAQVRKAPRLQEPEKPLQKASPQAKKASARHKRGGRS
ncbi:YhgE/Pip domain-containing protein [Adlercreutzia murintestinalis]|uniref:YhgE/Pip domain-containing protein n=1 Tax=Adlercreutzia murintestinalis TaxID=2941325 RepID=UPI00203E4F21|nr:YhgE/Pip family protein [Adlercreutzia murintestinalis]